MKGNHRDILGNEQGRTPTKLHVQYLGYFFCQNLTLTTSPLGHISSGSVRLKFF